MWKLSPKVLFLILSIVMLTNQPTVNSATLQCEYHLSSGSGDFFRQNLYSCKVIDNGIFTGERLNIDKVEGEHSGGYINAFVNKFYIFGKVNSLKFFPQNLQNMFGDLLDITISFTDLQEIRRNDLKYFPKLKNLYLAQNKITSIDEDLFEFNPELRSIFLHKNQISHIDPNVFDDLDHLHILSLSNIWCKNAFNDVSNKSKSAVLKLTERVRSGECNTNPCSTKYESCVSNLTSIIDEKPMLLKQISELREKLFQTEKTIEQLRDENKQIQITVHELKMANENMMKDLTDEAAAKET